MTTATLTLSGDALYEVCRSLADRGEDYGWNVYLRGNRIPAADRLRMTQDDDAAVAWIDAFYAATEAYETATGETWRY